MKEDDIITINGFDYNTVQKAADNGEEWAEEWVDGFEFTGSYIKSGANEWTEMTYESEPTVLNRAGMMNLISNSKPPIKDKKKLRKAYKEMSE